MTALLVVDVQDGFDDPSWGRRNNPDAEANIADLLAAWRSRGDRVFHIKHNSRSPASPLRPAHPGNAIKAFAAPRPSEPVIKKSVNSGFIGTDLEAQLRRAHVRDVVIVGFTTPHCVSTTTRMAANLGFDTRVVSDATAAFEWRSHDGVLIPPEDMHYHALAALSGEFATVVTASDLLHALS